MYTNSVIDCIKTRRSVRRYRKEQIDKGLLEIVLECALSSPSALNKQPWQVRVIQNETVLSEINKQFVEWASKQRNLQGSAKRAAEEGFSVFHHAPTLIVVARDKNNHYSAGDCGMLAQNIMLSAHSLGLGACVIGNVATVANVSPSLFFQTMNIPKDYEVAFGIAIGYPDETPDEKPRDTTKIEWIE